MLTLIGVIDNNQNNEGGCMKLWTKILIVCAGGAISWGLAYCSSIWPTWAVVLASVSSASTAAVGIVVGWSPKT